MFRRLLLIALYPVAIVISAILCIRRIFERRNSKPLPHPLTRLDDQELITLAGRLDSPATHPDLTNLHSLDGFFVCIAIGPEPISPTKWLDAIFSQRLPGTGEEIDELLNLLQRFHNQIVSDARTGSTYRPQCPVSPSAAKQAWTSWCRGFMAAASWQQAQWQTLLDRDDPTSPLYPIRRRAAGDAASQPKIPFGLPQCQKAINRIRRHWGLDHQT